MTAAFKTVDEYIAAQPASTQKALQRVRTAIRKAVPSADEVIAYNMPAYKLGARSLLQFAAWKEHYALYLGTKPIVAALKDELRECEVDKGTIRFAFADPVPEKLIGRIAKLRADRNGTAKGSPQ